MEPIEIIRAACIKANPKLETRNTSMLLDGVFTGIINHRDPTIRLSDVLLALGSANVYDTSAYFIYKNGSVVWDLTKGSLTQQSPETLAFLAGLLDTK